MMIMVKMNDTNIICSKREGKRLLYEPLLELNEMKNVGCAEVKTKQPAPAE